jgi:hypothetical protein
VNGVNTVDLLTAAGGGITGTGIASDGSSYTSDGSSSGDTTNWAGIGADIEQGIFGTVAALNPPTTVVVPAPGYGQTPGTGLLGSSSSSGLLLLIGIVVLVVVLRK